MPFEPIQLRVPKTRVAKDPSRKVPERLRRQLECVLATATGAANEPRSLEHPDMFAEPRERHRKSSGDVGDASRPARQALRDRAASRVGQCRQHGVKFETLGILNHSVQYIAALLRRSSAVRGAFQSFGKCIKTFTSLPNGSRT